jgi:poly(A) polymerase
LSVKRFRFIFIFSMFFWVSLSSYKQVYLNCLRFSNLPDANSPMKLPLDLDFIPDKTGIFIVGGSVRDLLCGKTPTDYDIVVEGDPYLVARRLVAKTRGRLVEFGKPGQRIIRVVSGVQCFDIMSVYGGSIVEDLRRRDFTINAIALELTTGSLIDQFGGRRDLTEKKIRMVSSDVFRKDPVRLIRAFRLKATLGLRIEAYTEGAIGADAHLIATAAGERIREELVKILKCSNSHESVIQMARTGLLFYIIPVSAKLKNSPTAIDVPLRTIQRILFPYHQLEILLNKLDQLLPTVCRYLAEDIGQNRAILLKLAALVAAVRTPTMLRKTSKRSTVRVDGYDRKENARVTEICHRLRCSRRETDFIGFLLKNQTKAFSLFNARQKKIPLRKAMMRFFMTCEELTPGVLLLAMANGGCPADPNEPLRQPFSAFILNLLQTYYAVFQQEASLPPLLNGDDLITELGLKPSAKFRWILTELRAERLLNLAMTRTEAIEMVKHLISRQRRMQ